MQFFLYSRKAPLFFLSVLFYSISMINIRFILCSIPFFIICLIHLFARLTDYQKLGNRTKPFILICLIGAVFVYCIISKISLLQNLSLIIALFSGCLGDILLLGQLTDKKFAGGILAFLTGHIFYISIILQIFDFSSVNLNIVILVLAIYAVVIFILWNSLNRPKGIKGGEIIIYAGVESADSFLPLFLIISQFQGIITLSNIILEQLAVIFTGGIIFLISDSILAYTIFIKKFKCSDFFVMLTYIIAQYMLTLGLLQK